MSLDQRWRIGWMLGVIWVWMGVGGAAVAAAPGPVTQSAEGAHGTEATGLSDEEREAIAEEIRQAQESGQSALREGRCEEMVDHWLDLRPVLVANGKIIEARERLVTGCEAQAGRQGDTQAGPAGPPPGEFENRIHVLSPTSAYAVRWRTDVDEPLVVTTIWSKHEGEWHLVHLHESKKPAAGDDGAPTAPPEEPEG